jgi:hypothetical protein
MIVVVGSTGTYSAAVTCVRRAMLVGMDSLRGPWTSEQSRDVIDRSTRCWKYRTIPLWWQLFGDKMGAAVVGDKLGAGVVGDAVGAKLGDVVGAVGAKLGDAVGAFVVGDAVGRAVGAPVGDADGIGEGAPVGNADGISEGGAVGIAVGAPLGIGVGGVVGIGVVGAVGDIEGAPVTPALSVAPLFAPSVEEAVLAKATAQPKPTENTATAQRAKNTFRVKMLPPRGFASSANRGLYPILATSSGPSPTIE